MNTIAIDCGASFLKGALFHEGTIVIQKTMPSVKVHGTESIFDIVQIDELYHRFVELLSILSEGEKHVRLCISNEMHGFILVREDGTPYTDYISWQKEYGNEVIGGQSSASILSDASFADDIVYSGMGVRGGLPSANLLYLKRKSYLSINDSLYFYTLGDYIIRRLSRTEPNCHPTNAAATGLYDFRTNDWNLSLIQLVSTNTMFPRIGYNSCSFTFNSIEYDCLPAIGDQQAALLGAGLKSETDISFNIGTGGQVSCVIDDFERSNNPSIQIRPYFNGKFLRTVPHIPSGRALNVFFRFFKDIARVCNCEIDDELLWKDVLNEVDQIGTSNLSVDLSFFQNPITNENKGNISQIGEYDLSLGSLMFSVYSQMASNIIYAANEVLNKENVCRILFSGGVIKKTPILQRFILSYYPRTLEYEIVDDETLNGLYLLSKGKVC